MVRPSPIIPAHVATGELITSAWGNGVVDSLGNAAVNWGSARLPSTPLVSGSTILHQAVAAVPYATWMFVTANGYAGSDSGNMDAIFITIATQQPGTTWSSPGVTGTGPNRFQGVSATNTWAVPANGSAQFSISVAWGAVSGGTTYVVADLLWWQFRQ
jgi:hypothetical protein